MKKFIISLIVVAALEKVVEIYYEVREPKTLLGKIKNKFMGNKKKNSACKCKTCKCK